MLDSRLLDILVCPECKGELEYRTDGEEMLVCHSCSLGYPVRDGIPIMLSEDALRMSETKQEKD
ncbi:tetraacyldisaccharide 4'-kinase [Candidatus Fermentibacteria bacterium]|nr:MAG: tetraacyldisaccharide 4'-kinase [Candidatus Fermentibacteria bacterium]